jgi:hypothetical protein
MMKPICLDGVHRLIAQTLDRAIPLLDSGDIDRLLAGALSNHALDLCNAVGADLQSRATCRLVNGIANRHNEAGPPNLLYAYRALKTCGNGSAWYNAAVAALMLGRTADALHQLALCLCWYAEKGDIERGYRRAALLQEQVNGRIADSVPAVYVEAEQMTT